MFINFLAETKFPMGNVLPVGEAVSQGIFTTIYGLCTVFCVLLIIMFSIMAMRFFFSLSEKKKDKSKDEDKVKIIEDTVVEEPASNVVDDSEIVAVITAAICASTGAAQSDIIIKSFRRVNDKNAWGSMGIKDQLNKSL